jgi:hypothetical protein
MFALPIVAACGGGGNSSNPCHQVFQNGQWVTVCSPDPASSPQPASSPTVSTAIPEGIWGGGMSTGIGGATITGLAVSTLVLETGQYFIIPTSTTATGTSTGSPGTKTVPGVGLVEGLLSARAGSFSDSAGVVYPWTDIPVATAMSGSFSSKTSLSGTLNPTLSLSAPFPPPSAMPITFNGDYNPVYDTPATVVEGQGAWTGEAIGSSTWSNLTINADGSFSGGPSVPPTSPSAPDSCLFSGSLAPRSTGKHVLDGTVTFNNDFCVLPQGNSMPIEAVVYANGHQIFVAGVSVQRDHSFVFVSTR